MRKTVPPGDLAEGFEPGPVPTVGADGHVQMSGSRPPLPPRPRMCDAGPCRHYHRLEIQVDAANPRAQKIPIRLPVLQPGMEASPGGVIWQAPAAFHTVVEHYCYPDIGIEMDLGATPVVECNRWSPRMYGDGGLNDAVIRNRDQFWQSRAGQEHAQAVAAWEAARAREAAQAQEAEQLIQAALEAQGDDHGTDDGSNRSE
jgi:hypothetical protein